MNRRELLHLGLVFPFFGLSKSDSSRPKTLPHSFIVNYRKVGQSYNMLTSPHEMTIDCKGRDCAFIKRYSSVRPHESVVETQKSAAEVSIQMFENAANPQWEESKPDLWWLGRAQAAMDDQENKTKDHLESRFYDEFGYYPSECIIPFQNWDTALPADGFRPIRKGYVVYRTMGMIMLG